MKTIGIIGYGALGQQIECFLIEAGNNPATILRFDDTSSDAVPFNTYLNEKYKDLSFYIGLGYNHLELKNKILKDLRNNKRKSPSFIHPTAYIHPTVKLSIGCIIYPMACIDQRVEIKQGTLVNNAAVISHDSIINECCFIAPNATLCGNVNVGAHTFIGAGVIISNNITVGNNCRLAIGTILTKELPDNHSLIGYKNTITSKKINL